MTTIVAHWPAILTVLLIVLPSIATGLSKYPKTKGVGAAIKVLLDRLSVLSHADAAGTFKHPLTRSKKPPVAKPARVGK